jgi:peptidyl-prolyl cis-trans isomerase D
MLQKLNERIQGVVAWVVIILIAVTFTLFGIDYYMQSRHESTAQVEVNGQPISKQAFEVNYRRIRQLRDPALMNDEAENQLKQQVMNEMIVSTVSVQSAQSNGFDVGVSQANGAILSIPQFQQDGRFSTDRYQQALNSALFTPDSFQKEVRQGMLLNQQRFAFIGTAFALPSEIRQFVKLYMQTRNYDYMSIPVQQFQKQVTVSSQQIEEYYKKHQKQFLSPELVTLDYVLLSMNDIKKSIKISEQQLKRYYEENQDNYLKPAQWKVAHILISTPPDASPEALQRIKQRADETYSFLKKKPGQFDKTVATTSDDKISSLNGGVLPWIVGGQSEFDKALVNVTTPGIIMPPVKSRYGYEIFKLLAYTPASVKPLNDVRSEIEEQLRIDQAQTKYAQALEQLSDLSYQTPDSLLPVAEALQLTVKESAPLSRKGSVGDLESNKQIIRAAFSHDVLGLGNNSEPVQLDNDSVVVLRIKQHVPSAVKTLAEVQSVILEKLSKFQAKYLAERLGKELLSASNDAAMQNKLMTDHHLKWKSVAQASRDSDISLVEMTDIAFKLGKVGDQSGRSLNNGNYVIVELKKLNDGQLALLDKEQLASITQQIEANYGMMDYDLYVSNLMSKAKIVKH